MEIETLYKGADTELDKLKKKGAEIFKDIKALTVLVNTGNTIGRNRLCLCKSGKKWKCCCIIHHEAQTLVLEKMCKDYGVIIREFQKLTREKGL